MEKGKDGKEKRIEGIKKFDRCGRAELRANDERFPKAAVAERNWFPDSLQGTWRELR
jgi:hypothetical protein